MLKIYIITFGTIMILIQIKNEQIKIGFIQYIVSLEKT